MPFYTWRFASKKQEEKRRKKKSKKHPRGIELKI